MDKNIEQAAWKWLNENELSYTIWNNKYRYNNESFDEWLEKNLNNGKIKVLNRYKEFTEYTIIF